jgi:DNA-binding IclR family transcriptional regulator
MNIVKSGSTIQSLQIGISIIDLISSNNTPMRFSDIQEATGITKSNLYKYLNTLTQLNILYRDKTTSMYQLGNKLIQYGMAAIGHNDTIARITPYLQEISAYTSCTVLFSVWSHHGPITAKIWNSNNILNIGAQLGSNLPPSSSTGKIFTAFLDASQTKEWLEHEGQNGREMKEEEIVEIKKQHIAFAREPLVTSISSMSIPILNFNHELLGTVTVVGFTDTIPTDPNDQMSRYLIRYHKEISSVFGYPDK